MSDGNQNRPKRLRNESGTTLMDLLAGMALTAIAGAVATPGMYDLMEVYQLRATSDNVLVGLSMSRMLSATQARFTCVRMTTGKLEIWVAPAHSTDCNAAGEPHQSIGLSNIVAIPAVEIQFNGNGEAVTRPSIEILARNATRTITVDPMGGAALS